MRRVVRVVMERIRQRMAVMRQVVRRVARRQGIRVDLLVVEHSARVRPVRRLRAVRAVISQWT